MRPASWASGWSWVRSRLQCFRAPRPFCIRWGRVIGPVPLTATITAEEWETIRIEAGLPRWGVELTEDTIPVEAGLDRRAISYDKGCYIGQETIARIKTYGHVNRCLVQMAMEADTWDAASESRPVLEGHAPSWPRFPHGRDEARPSKRHIRALPASATDSDARQRVAAFWIGQPIFAEDRKVGWVTSATESKRLGKWILLGYLRREFAAPGAALTINHKRAEVLKVCGT